MKYFLDNTKVKLEDLRSIGIYDAYLLDELEEGHFDKLKGLAEEYTENRNYMEPILYAMLDKFGTYEVYQYYGDKLKDYLKTEIKLSEAIITTNPELIEDSPIGENKELILKYKDANPEIIQYISDDLSNDKEFLEELCTSNNAEVIKEAVEKYSAEKLIAANPELKSDERFMALAISKDVTAIRYADKNILNSYDVFREASINNSEVISYVIDNNKELGIEAVSGARDTAKEKADKGYMDVINENAEKSDDARFKKVRDKVAERGENNPAKIRWITAMAAQCEEVNPGLINEVLDYVSLSRIKLERMMEENKDYEISKEDALELVTPQIINRLIEKSGMQEISPEMQQRLEEYVEFYSDFEEKFSEQKRARLEKSKEAEKQTKSKEEKLRAEISGHSSSEDYEKAAREWEERKAARDNDRTHETSLEK